MVRCGIVPLLKHNFLFVPLQETRERLDVCKICKGIIILIVIINRGNNRRLVITAGFRADHVSRRNDRASMGGLYRLGTR
jgi:hypothetical protein